MSGLGTIEESDSQLSNDDASEDFVYPNGDSQLNHKDEEEEEFVYPGSSSQPSEDTDEPAPVPTPAQPRPSPAQLESLYAAVSSGDLALLKKLFRNALESNHVESFSLSNEASARTGLTALHAAASRGYLDIVQWLVEECGAITDMEDKEGEASALNGHLHVIKYLLPDKADVHVRDADGWTALHNACSKGYLDIVRWLCEHGGATTEVAGARGVDARSKGGWTPLMNAASKGHLPVVLYLLSKQKANPLIRNNWGETAYDAAAAVFEVWICEALQKAEAEQWRGTTVPYNPLSVHTTVPLVLYENNRLDTRLKTLAVSGGRPKFSASGLGRHGRRAPFELRLLAQEEAGGQLVPAWRSDVQLPLRDSPWVLPRPGSTHLEGAERSHFWLSDWTLDVTHPGVDAEEGWQYAHHFDDPDDQWTADMPPQLERLLTGGVTLSPNLGQPSSRRSPQPATWVRRRRWVRVMRRRLDIPPLPFLLPDGSMYHIGPDGNLIPYSENSADNHTESEGQELGAMSSNFFSMAEDYVGRARYLVGSQTDSGTLNLSAIEARRAIAKLERATTELRQGILADEDLERKTQAEVLLNAYSRELERRRLAAGAQGLLISGDDADVDLDGDDSDEEFHYPGASPRASSIRPTLRAASISSGSTDYFSRPETVRQPTDLTPQLSQAPDFRVPTHEAPQKVTRWTTPSPHQIHQWERDEDVSQCRDCHRRFNFITRRHVDPSDIVHEPGYIPNGGASSSSQRVCQNCFEEVNGTLPGRVAGIRAGSMERVFVDQERLNVPGHLTRRQSSSQLSDLAECPVCNTNLDHVGGATEQEAHVKNCLEGGAGTTPQAAKYLVYKLPSESALIGVECVICLEEFVKGSMVARLSCFCSFHNACLSSWLQRGKNCPVHAR
ncbi:hypothetical protein D9758_001168 [Tetrapyrgos nigripes]|uniref:RING-type domain-containing protein n=1 Tax=Tetrapyrgos nigripes TaxID=182062 RepID=A0A8H5LUJ1_9AGAR|nr:hypothetical protein D9758_001168 [Tetrapyrgos nigripes]